MIHYIKSFDYFFWLSYIFSMRAHISPLILKGMAVVFVVLLVVGLVIRLVSWQKRGNKLVANLLRRYADCLAIMGILGIIMVACYYEAVPILSARLMILLWLVASAWWLTRIINYQYKIMPQTQKILEQKKLLNKYLPSKR